MTLTAADFVSFPPDLADRLTAAALHQDRCRRAAARLDLPPGFTGTAQAVGDMDEHAAAIAEGARFVALVRRFMADEGHRRPAAQVMRLHMVPKPAASPTPRPSLVARALAAIARPASSERLNRSEVA